MSTPTASNNTSKGSPFDGESFSNNLLSDLAPLLTLFGEQVTKQFLSLSMGWADNILIALGPLGIMTILVSTIRVSGNKRLKALLGRARESRMTAEAELLSSTSDEVCEMWNGHEIIRTFGAPESTHLVVSCEGGPPSLRNVREAIDKGYLVDDDRRPLRDLDDALDHGAPNLTLNAPGSEISNIEVWLWVSLGTTLQIATLVAPEIMMRNNKGSLYSYGYICYVGGTVMLTCH
ncbi:hypothetical protein N0V83_007744 [Neocucurbitaria cava]|uniref:Uncharacterized protein n=1 Tax=Neocucurbitaria cava TaxID=798079 RepID=A0A9W8Y3D7_9PLEO|nr:hypothetical protein N0V83_007744 [Neocucurbitaria cava]